MTPFNELLQDLAFRFGPPEYVALMVLVMCAAVVVAPQPILKSTAMLVGGLTLGSVGTDVNSGVERSLWGLSWEEVDYVLLMSEIMVFGYLLPCVIVAARVQPGDRPINLWATFYFGLALPEAWPALFLLWLNRVPKRISVPVSACFAAMLSVYLDLPSNAWPASIGLVLGGLLFLHAGLSWVPGLIGFIVSARLEENFRRTLLLSRGDWSTFIERPISGGLLVAAIVCLMGSVYFRRRLSLRYKSRCAEAHG